MLFKDCDVLGMRVSFAVSGNNFSPNAIYVMLII